MMAVFHAENPSFGFDWKESEVEEGTFSRVCFVDTDSLEEAYRLTNHITEDWTSNREVYSPVPSSRSTSVGDVIGIISDGKITNLHVVAGRGFAELDFSKYKDKFKIDLSYEYTVQKEFQAWTT